MRNTADVTGGKPIAVFLQSMSGVIAINPLVVFYDIHEGNREVLFYFVPFSTRDPELNALVLKFIFNKNFKTKALKTQGLVC
jgi:hypothetical protein